MFRLALEILLFFLLVNNRVLCQEAESSSTEAGSTEASTEGNSAVATETSSIAEPSSTEAAVKEPVNVEVDNKNTKNEEIKEKEKSDDVGFRMMSAPPMFGSESLPEQDSSQVIINPPQGVSLDLSVQGGLAGWSRNETSKAKIQEIETKSISQSTTIGERGDLNKTSIPMFPILPWMPKVPVPPGGCESRRCPPKRPPRPTDGCEGPWCPPTGPPRPTELPGPLIECKGPGCPPTGRPSRPDRCEGPWCPPIGRPGPIEPPGRPGECEGPWCPPRGRPRPKEPPGRPGECEGPWCPPTGPLEPPNPPPVILPPPIPPPIIHPPIPGHGENWWCLQYWLAKIFGRDSAVQRLYLKLRDVLFCDCADLREDPGLMSGVQGIRRKLRMLEFRIPIIGWIIRILVDSILTMYKTIECLTTCYAWRLFKIHLWIASFIPYTDPYEFYAYIIEDMHDLIGTAVERNRIFCPEERTEEMLIASSPEIEIPQHDYPDFSSMGSPSYPDYGSQGNPDFATVLHQQASINTGGSFGMNGESTITQVMMDESEYPGDDVSRYKREKSLREKRTAHNDMAKPFGS